MSQIIGPFQNHHNFRSTARLSTDWPDWLLAFRKRLILQPTRTACEQSPQAVGHQLAVTSLRKAGVFSAFA